MLLTKQEILRYGLIERKKDKTEEHVNCGDCSEFDICNEKVDCADWKTATEDPIHDYAYVPGPWAEKCIRIKKEMNYDKR